MDVKDRRRLRFKANVLLCRCSDQDPSRGFYLMIANKFHGYILMTSDHIRQTSLEVRGVVMGYLNLTVVEDEDAVSQLEEFYANNQSGEGK